MNTTNTRYTASNSSNSSDTGATTTATTYALNGKIMLCTVIILFSAVFVILGFHTYARWLVTWCRRRRRRQNSRLLHLHHRAPVEAASRGAQGCVVPQGLDINILKTLPTFLYSDATCASRDRECPVCLSEFVDGETGRVLPECKHCFHAECIDMWFYSHSSCPVCRSPVRPGKSANSGSETVPADVSGSDPPDRAVLPDPDSPSTSAEKVDDLVSILVEEPQCMEERYKGMENMGPGHTVLNECNRVKSPANRILYMKRIWSI